MTTRSYKVYLLLLWKTGKETEPYFGYYTDVSSRGYSQGAIDRPSAPAALQTTMKWNPTSLNL